MPDTPFRVEVVTVTGLTVAGSFPIQLAAHVGLAYLEDDRTFPLRTTADRPGMRTVLLKLYAELLHETGQVQLLDDEGVLWLIPGDRILAIRIVDPERTPGPPREDEVRQIGFQFRSEPSPVARTEPGPTGGGRPPEPRS